jgi:hypothetical protein
MAELEHLDQCAGRMTVEQKFEELRKAAQTYLNARDAYREFDSSKNLDAMSFAEEQLRVKLGQSQ